MNMNSHHRSDQMLEDENEGLESTLANKVQTLKSVSILCTRFTLIFVGLCAFESDLIYVTI